MSGIRIINIHALLLISLTGMRIQPCPI